MADRTETEDDQGVPKEVFELDQDERWQARLEEARARREVALAEKAAGKPQKKRLKPWEEEGEFAVDAPIEPIIQERGDDKFDFADRLEAIRENAASEISESETDLPVQEEDLPHFVPEFEPEPEPEPEFTPPPARQATPSSPMPEPRARPQPSLVLPGAPDVADIASRYAATLEAAQAPVEPVERPTTRVTSVVPMRPGALVEQVVQQPAVALQADTRRSRRVGVRPMGMAFGLIFLAAMPFATLAPPLETGPEMPQVAVFHITPALGVTWSLSNRPATTFSGEWTPAPAPAPLAGISEPVTGPVRSMYEPVLLQNPEVPASINIAWHTLVPVERSLPISTVYSVEASNAPVIPTESPIVPLLRALDGAAVGRPPVKPIARGQLETSPVAPPRPSDRESSLDSSLRVTILKPRQASTEFADRLAASVRSDGHEFANVRDTDARISTRNLRFFHEADRAQAVALADRYQAELRDFTGFSPKPQEGSVELWLSSEPGEERSDAIRFETLADVEAYLRDWISARQLSLSETTSGN